MKFDRFQIGNLEQDDHFAVVPEEQEKEQHDRNAEDDAADREWWLSSERSFN